MLVNLAEYVEVIRWNRVHSLTFVPSLNTESTTVRLFGSRTEVTRAAQDWGLGVPPGDDRPDYLDILDPEEVAPSLQSLQHSSQRRLAKSA